ncbi:dephospho-CoA kinase [Burkholderia ubonensis]|uniref:dephospho-CoA kinase n=1 Tax=Burkholderia ubonensis TaxID=101571 RepID=UPI0009B3490E|nr:dephospho-CoA kinase [Burkholderia ubonensis]
MRIVVTGGIGSGKSTVCKALHALMPGYELVSADQMVHDLYASNAQFRADLVKRFGTAERKEVSMIVFENPARRLELVTLSWAYLAQAVDAVFEKPDVIFEFPLFFEHPHWLGRPDAVVLVGCDEPTQRARVLERDGISADNFERIKRAQLPLAEKVEKADIYLDTSGSLDSVLKAVADLPEKLRSLALTAVS